MKLNLTKEHKEVFKWLASQTLRIKNSFTLQEIGEGVGISDEDRVFKILKELFQNEDRQYADLAAIRVLDAEGRDWVGGSAARIPLTFGEPDIGRMFGEQPIAWPPMAVRVEPTTARAIAHVQAEVPAAAILNNRFGEGEADLVTTADGAFDADDSFWTGLAALAAKVVVGTGTGNRKNNDVSEQLKNMNISLDGIENEDCTVYSPVRTFKIGESIYHENWDDFGKVISKETLSNGQSSISVEFQKSGFKKLIESLNK